MAIRDQSKADYWQRMIRRQASSGLSVRAWCGRHDLSEASFYWWRRRLARRDAVARTPRSSRSGRSAHRTARRGGSAQKANRRETAMPRFVPVRVAADNTVAADHMGAADRRPSCIEIILSGTQRLRVLGAVDCQALADVLAVLHSGDVEPRTRVDTEAAGC